MAFKGSGVQSPSAPPYIRRGWLERVDPFFSGLYGNCIVGEIERDFRQKTVIKKLEPRREEQVSPIWNPKSQGGPTIAPAS